MKKGISVKARYKLGLILGMVVVMLLAITRVVTWVQTGGFEEPDNLNTRVEARPAAPIAAEAGAHHKKTPAGEAKKGYEGRTVNAATTAVPAQRVGTVPESSPGMKVYVNPSTGNIETPPADVRAAMAAAESSLGITSGLGLVETPSPLPGGGIMVDLQGQFDSPMVATRDADGNLTIGHSPAQPESKKE